MTVVAFLLIVASAGLHAGWNLLTKANRPSPLFFLLMDISQGLLLLPIVMIDRQGFVMVFRDLWPLLVVTGLFESLYYTGVALSYRKNDMTLAYPLIRSLPVLIIPLISGLLHFGEPLSPVAVLGMLLVFTGCVMIPLRSYRTWHIRDYLRSTMLWILPAALGTVGYTLVDGFSIASIDGAELTLPTSLIYSGLLNLSIIPWMVVSVTILGDWKSSPNFRGKKLFAPLFAGIGAGSAYLLVLSAMRYVTNISYVSGFRQLSIPIGVLLGLFVLKEKIVLPRVVGTLVLTVGLVVIAFN